MERGVGERGVLEPAYVGDLARVALSSERPVQAPLPVRGPPAPLELRRRDHRQHDLVVDDERDQRRPHRARRGRSSWCRRSGRSPSGAGCGRCCPAPRRGPRRASATRDSVRRIDSSTAWSASVTGVRSGLLITCRSSALKRVVVMRVRVVGQHMSQAEVVGVVGRGGRHGHRLFRTEPGSTAYTYLMEYQRPARCTRSSSTSSSCSRRLAAIGGILYAVVPRWRWWLRWPLVVTLVDRRRCRGDRRPVRPAAGDPAQPAVAAGARDPRPPGSDPARGCSLAFLAVAAARSPGSSAVPRALASGARRLARAGPVPSRSRCRSLLVAGAIARAGLRVPHRRLGRPQPLGLSHASVRRLGPARPAAAGTTRRAPGRRRRAATASSSPHSGSSAPWVQPRGQSSVISSRSGNASIRSLRARRARARTSGRPGCR